MGFLFRDPKLDREEFNQCLKYLEEHYTLTTFQEKEADIYNESLTQYMPSLMSDSHSAKEMLKVAERFKKTAHLLLKRSKELTSVPEPAGALHFAWQIVFSDYTAWVDAQYAVYKAIAENKQPFVEHVQNLFRKQDKSQKKALKEEKKLLNLLRANGLKVSDIQALTDKAFLAIEAKRWQLNEKSIPDEKAI